MSPIRFIVCISFSLDIKTIIVVNIEWASLAAIKVIGRAIVV